MSMPDQGQSLTPTENVDRGFILHSTLPAQWTVCQPLCRSIHGTQQPTYFKKDFQTRKERPMTASILEFPS
jgi:hypothetical protein